MALKHRFALPLIAVIFLAFVGGCSQPGPLPKGIVKFEDGERVQSGSIELRSIQTQAPYAGRISKTGHFTLRNEDGDPELPVDDYEVVVVQIVLTEDLPADQHNHGRTVPRKYADYNTSGLKYTNPADRTEPIVIELSVDP